MNRDEIIRMAQEAGIRVAGPMDSVDPKNIYAHELERFAALVQQAALERNNMTWVANCQHLIKADREECAKVCLDIHNARGSAWDCWFALDRKAKQ